MIWHERVQRIEDEIKKLPPRELGFRSYDKDENIEESIKVLIRNQIRELDENIKQRIWDEFDDYGPLTPLLADESITEIIVNGPNAIWFEKSGKLQCFSDYFSSGQSYTRFIQKICHAANAHFNLERPMADGKFKDFRVHIMGEELTRDQVVVALRRHPKNPWNLKRLESEGWAQPDQIRLLQRIVDDRENFLVVGGTGSGKTSVLNACLQALPNEERVLIIEDTMELSIPNRASTRLLTRHDCQGLLPGIDQMELVKQSLRMRPDRIVNGEIRGPEAKDLLLALSTGHAGSFATLHAQEAHQALLRLEMLVQLGAPFWSIDAIRNLIFLSLQKIIVVHRRRDGHRELEGIYALSSRESSGILIERMA